MTRYDCPECQFETDRSGIFKLHLADRHGWSFQAAFREAKRQEASHDP